MDNNVILIVEDNADDVLLIKRALEHVGVRNLTQVAQDGNEAIAYLDGEGRFANRTKYPLPRVVFLDLNLPGKTGHEILAWMAEREALGEIVRVVLTGSDDPSDLRKAYELGANSYLIKPLTAEQLTLPKRNLRMLLLGRPLLEGV